MNSLQKKIAIKTKTPMFWTRSGENVTHTGFGELTTYHIIPKLWPKVALVIAIILFCAAFATAGPVEDSAKAAIAVARAQVQVESERPQLEDTNAKPRAGQDSPKATEGTRAVQPIEASVEVSAVSKDRTSSGSGTVIECDGKTSKILTAAHIFDKLVDPEIAVAAAGKTWSATMLKIDRSVDLALLSVESSFPAVKVAKTIPADGTSVTSIGLGKAVETRIISLDTYDNPAVFFCSTREIEGRSGGGLFANGELVGVIKAYVNGRATSLYVATDPIHDFLASPSIKSSPLFVPCYGEMRLEPITPIQAGPRSIPVVTFYTGENEYGKGWCQHCPKYKAIFGNGNDRVRVEYSDELPKDTIGLFPALRFEGHDGTSYPADKHGHYKIPETLDDLADIVGRNATDNTQYAATGPAGAIHAKDKVQSAISYMRQYVGDGNDVHFSWSRNGAEKLNLLAATEWNIKDVIGTEGRIELGCPVAANLPTKEFAFGYRIRGSDMIFDADPVTVQGMLNHLQINNTPRSYGAVPIGIIGIDDALFAWSVISMIRDIAALLRPSCDLELPGELVATAVLNNDTINIRFDKPATVRMTWLFTVRLKLKELSIDSSEVKAFFDGSRFIKSRSFAIN